MYCGKCGARAEDTDEFCAECGSRLKMKKRKFVKNTIISGRGLLSDYSGIVVKISVILTFLVVTSGWFLAGEIIKDSLMSSGNILINLNGIQWNQLNFDGEQTIAFWIDVIKKLFLTWIQVQSESFRLAPMHLKVWYSLNSLYSIWITVMTFLGIWRLFEKAGIQGWKILIPIYNNYCISLIEYESGWIIFMQIIIGIILYMMLVLGGGAAGALIAIIILYGCFFLFYKTVSERYGHGVGCAIGLIVVPYIFLQLLGWSDEEYRE